MNPDTLAVRAAWILPASSPPVADGAIVVRDGRILWVGPASRCPAPATDIGDAAIVPGLVNAHTHLEFSGLERPLGDRDDSFADWIRAVVACRNSMLNAKPDAAPLSRRDVLLRGIDELGATGTSVAGEIATSPVTVADYQTASPTAPDQPPSNVAISPFFEILGDGPEDNDRWADAVRFVAEWNRGTGESGRNIAKTRAGLSPHAPYSVRPRLFAAAIQHAVQHELPLAMHLAETREERELLERGTGPLVELLRDLGTWDPATARQMSIEHCIAGIAQAPRALLVHGNYLTSGEMDQVARHPNLSVVYCPRTHGYFRHDPYPLASLRRRNVRVCVGTDSRASNPDLSLWKELQFVAARFPELDANEILAMGTCLAAEAIGVADELGSLQTGRAARLNVVRWPGGPSAAIRSSIDWLLQPTTVCEPLLLAAGHQG